MVASIAETGHTGNGWVYPQAMLAFLKSRPDGIDFRRRKLVLVGHSYGGSVVCVFTLPMSKSRPLTVHVLQSPPRRHPGPLLRLPRLRPA